MNTTRIDGLSDYRWLISSDAAAWLDVAAGWTGNLLAMTAHLRRSLTAAQAHLVIEQAALRLRAREKFQAADQMFFTPVGLEQATDQWVAEYKASRFPADGLAVDLCCGIGGDLLSLGARCGAIGIDRHPLATLFAAANCRICGINATVLTADAMTVSLHECQALHIDPDRRPRGRRTTQVELHDPSLADIERLVHKFPHVAIKLAPGSEPPVIGNEGAEWEWISRDGQCRQLVVWLGMLASAPGTRRATMLGKSAIPLRTVAGQEPGQPTVAVQIGRYLYEPDAAVLAAGLQGSLAEEHRLETVAAGIAYLTSDRLVIDPALATFEIEEHLPLDLKQLRGMLHQRGIGRLEIKKRGVPNDPETLRRQLNLRGENEGVLIVTRHREQTVAFLCRRLCATKKGD